MMALALWDAKHGLQDGAISQCRGWFDTEPHTLPTAPALSREPQETARTSRARQCDSEAMVGRPIPICWCIGERSFLGALKN